MQLKETFCGNFPKGKITTLYEVYNTWSSMCPVGEDSFKLYLSIESHGHSKPFYIFEKESAKVAGHGTEECEIGYGVGMPVFTDNMVRATSHSADGGDWLNLLLYATKENMRYKIEEVEAADFFVRVVLKKYSLGR